LKSALADNPATNPRFSPAASEAPRKNRRQTPSLQKKGGVSPQRKEGRARGKRLTDIPYEHGQETLTARIPLAGRAGKA